jgi:tRNA pseudouridine65 synthase
MNQHFLDKPLTILYQDEYLIAAYKPEGLLVHKSNVDKNETQFLLQILRDQVGEYLYPIHRLDKPSSGLILFGLNAAVTKHIQQQMQSNTAIKEYLLICRGYTPESVIINHPLTPINDFKSKASNDFKNQANDDIKLDAGVIKTTKPAQQAITHITRLDTIELNVAIDKYPSSRYSLVQAKLLTGRKHQIRRHMKHISHPIIGCPKYGKSTHNRYFAETYNVSRLLLHSYKMTFEHPVNGLSVVITAKPQGGFKHLMQSFDWQLP